LRLIQVMALIMAFSLCRNDARPRPSVQKIYHPS
jgi:hypothetical protein